MLVVMEKLQMNRDGQIMVGRREWNYKAVARETKATECGMSPLAIWAMLHGCAKLTVIEGRQVWESETDSSRMFLEAGK